MNNPNPHRNNSQSPQTINVAACIIMVDGLKAEYHIMRHQTKQQAHPFDAGIDLFPARVEPQVERYGDMAKVLVSTMVHFVLPAGTCGIVTERSSSWKKLPPMARVPRGVIDAGYTGELIIPIICRESDVQATLDAVKLAAESETALAQFIPQPTLYAVFDKLDLAKVAGARGSNGFGSTDKLKV